MLAQILFKRIVSMKSSDDVLRKRDQIIYPSSAYTEAEIIACSEFKIVNNPTQQISLYT